MPLPGGSRQRLATTLNAAYGDGLLSENTFVRRLDDLLHSEVVRPEELVGDLTFRSSQGTLSGMLARVRAAVRSGHGEPWHREPAILALDWSGTRDDLLVGRHRDCDVVVSDATVSRRHARLRFRDGRWVLQDLGSTNGTTVNDVRVVRCQLQPGDLLELGDATLLVD